MISRRSMDRAGVLNSPGGFNRKNFNINRGGKLDKDADKWARARRLKNPLEIQRLSRYVRGIKKMGFWINGLISYPLGSLQNSAGSEVHAIMPGSLPAATIVGTVARSRTGLIFATSGQRVELAHAFPNQDSFYFCMALKYSTGAQRVAMYASNFSVTLQVGISNPPGNPNQVVLTSDENDEGDNRIFVDVNSPDTNFQFLQFYYEQPGGFYGAKVNDGSVTTAPADENEWIINPGNIRLGSNNQFVGEISFFALTEGYLPSESQMQSFYALYKSTLGQGLGLP